jgi:enoyl-CoA hydratase
VEALQHIRIDRKDDGLVHVTLDRPPANAVNKVVIDELARVAEKLSSDDTRVVVLRSAAPMFMAGADLNMVDTGWDALHATIAKFQAAVNKWEAIPVPTIAVIGGHAAGAGCELSLACDWRLMARGKPRIGLPEVRRGLLPAGGGTQRMTRLLGTAHARDLCMRGLLIDADRAEQIGLVSEAVDPDRLDARAEELTTELLSLPTMTLRAIKRCVVRGSDTDLAGGLAIEKDEMSALGDTLDTHEGVRAFVEKREPVFRHR